VALYTASLPYAILVFRAMESHWPPKIVGHTPLFITIFLALIYTGMGLMSKKIAHCAVILAISAVVVFFIMTFETNSNKYIHIPQYVLMSWLLYQALVIDYHGSGILLLIFICGAMLGVVDEIMQGIHPQRVYGWKDMIINAASGLIGALSLAGIKQAVKRKWAWFHEMRHFRSALAVALLGTVFAVPMCSYLFDVNDQKTFLNAYPWWLLICNGFFLGAGLAVMVFYWRRTRKFSPDNPDLKVAASKNQTTAMLWVICPLAILMSMHGLVLWVAAAGINYE
jgi:hypothetical protein